MLIQQAKRNVLKVKVWKTLVKYSVPTQFLLESRSWLRTLVFIKSLQLFICHLPIISVGFFYSCVYEE